VNGAARIDEQSVIKAYARWAPVYDFSFAHIAAAGRKSAIDIINRREGTLLEVGVGRRSTSAAAQGFPARPSNPAAPA